MWIPQTVIKSAPIDEIEGLPFGTNGGATATAGDAVVSQGGRFDAWGGDWLDGGLAEGGNVVAGGAESGEGGSAGLFGGSCATGFGGQINIAGGDGGAGSGGDVRITAGEGSVSNGTVQLRDYDGDAQVEVDFAALGFFGTAPVAKPEVPAIPTAQDVVDALVTLGLISQAP